MTTTFQTVCRLCEISVIGADVARCTILELLPCIGLKENDVHRRPRHVAEQITAYLDDLVRDP